MGNPMKSVSKEAVRKATLEAVAIAIGVFAALYADNWNEERKDQQLARQFLDGIALDMNLNSERILGVKTFARGYRDSLERVIYAIRTGENSWDSPESFVLDLVQCTYLGTPRLSSVAFDELQSTGSMRLIEDSDLKRKLANYYEDFEQQSQFHAEYRRKEAALEEALLGFLPLSDRIAISDNGVAVNSAIDIDQTLEEMRQVPNLLSRLEDMLWVQHRITTRYDDVIDYGNELLAHMAASN
jgi:hypothetical protein